MNLVRLQYGGGGGELHGAKIIVETDILDLKEKTVYLYNSTSIESIESKQLVLKSGTTYTCEFIVMLADTYKVVGVGDTKEYSSKDIVITNDDIINKSEISTIIVDAIELVSFSTGTDREIERMINGYYDGELTLSEIQSVWNIGDRRSIHLNAMPATYVSETHHEEDYDFIILGFEHDDLTTPINGKTKALISLQISRYFSDPKNVDYMQMDGVINSETGYMDDISTESITAGAKMYWRDCKRRLWCNNVALNALPSWIQPIVKEVKKITHISNSEYLTTNDKVWLLSNTEWCSNTYEVFGGDGTMYEFYKTNDFKTILPLLRDSYLYPYSFTRSAGNDRLGRSMFWRLDSPAEKYPSIQPSAHLSLHIAFCL